MGESSHLSDHRAAADSPPPGLISIIMPTYNRAHMVGRAIESVTAQTYPQWELILVNDGSVDGTREAIDGYAARDARIRCVHKANEGIPDTVNRGFSEVRGEFVTWTSDDNLYHPGALEAMKRFLDAHPDVGMVYTDVRDVNARDEVIREHVNTGEPEDLRSYCGIRGCLLLRTAVWAEAGSWHKRWVRCHDYDFYLRVARRFRVARMPEVWYDYRCHDDSMSGDHVAHALEEAELLAFHAPSGRERRRAWGRNLAHIGHWLENRGQPWRGVMYRLRACRHEPWRVRQVAAAFGRAMRHSWGGVLRACTRALGGSALRGTHREGRQT